MDKHKKTIAKVFAPILKLDGTLTRYYIYHILMIVTISIVVILFRNSFYSDHVYRNYREGDAVDLRFSMNMTYNMSFEAQSDSLSSFRIFMDPDLSRLRSSDMMHTSR